jgi:hypothetical protein
MPRRRSGLQLAAGPRSVRRHHRGRVPGHLDSHRPVAHPRAPYIPMLLAVTLGLGAGYLAWSGTSASDLLSSAVGWGLAAGLLAAAIALPLVRQLPAHPHATGTRLVGLLLWEGLVYGIAEAVLLSTLPVLAVAGPWSTSAGPTAGGRRSEREPSRSWARCWSSWSTTSGTPSSEPGQDDRDCPAPWPSAVCRRSRSW